MLKFLGTSTLHSIIDIEANVSNNKSQICVDDRKFLYKIYKSHVDNVYKIIGRKIESWEKYYNNLDEN